MELDPRTQMEGPGFQVPGRLPAGRKVGLHLQLRVLCRQPAEAVVDIIVVDAADANFLRVERRRLDRESHSERRWLGGSGRLNKCRQGRSASHLQGAAASDSRLQQSVVHRGALCSRVFADFFYTTAIFMPGMRWLGPRSLAIVRQNRPSGQNSRSVSRSVDRLYAVRVSPRRCKAGTSPSQTSLM